jgi:hypothetical protein
MRRCILNVVDNAAIETGRFLGGATLKLNGFHIHDDFPADTRLNIPD